MRAVSPELSQPSALIMPRVASITEKSDVLAKLHALTATVRRHGAWFLVPCVLALSVTSGSAQDKSPKGAPPPTSAPTSEADSYAYVAPSFIKELDSKYPLQPPVPPSAPPCTAPANRPPVPALMEST